VRLYLSSFRFGDHPELAALAGLGLDAAELDQRDCGRTFTASP
jgi:hypothetical protein